MTIIRRWYLRDKEVEYCFYVGLSEALTTEQEVTLQWLLGFIPGCKISDSSQLVDQPVLEIGPRLAFETAFSSCAVTMCRDAGLAQVERLEISRRYLDPGVSDREQFLAEHCDRMTQQLYLSPLESFEIEGETESVFTISVLTAGKSVLEQHSQDMGFGWDDEDLEMVFDLFVNKENRNPTNVELFQWAQANSNHSRHWVFKGRLIIDDEEMPDTLLELVMKAWKNRPGDSLIAFFDNSSAIRGFPDVADLFPKDPWTASVYTLAQACFHVLLTVETHNFPTGVWPFDGAGTGAGGRLRDDHATGRGAKAIAGTAAYCVAHLNIPGYYLIWEKPGEYPSNLFSALQIVILASDGASDYENKFGEPVILGFTHSLEIVLPDGQRWAFIKPIMMSGGIGTILDPNLDKKEPVPGMLLVRIGGPAYRIGFGGGAASSQMQGDNKAELDFNAVQRGNAEIEQLAFRVIFACSVLGIHHPEFGNLICSIHDQGAGGPCNVTTELAMPAGARLEIRNITLGDKTLPVIVIWGGEFQESYAILIQPQHLELLRLIGARENCPVDVLGEITGDGRIVVHDAQDDSTPVNLNLEDILGRLPKKIYRDQRQPTATKPLKLSPRVTVKSALNWVLRLLSVASKEHLTNKADRSVGGLVAQQQCCGPRQLPVSDLGVVALSHFDVVGAAMSIGERALAMILDPVRATRLAVAEMLTNICWAGGLKLEEIRYSGNWMCAAKLPGELAAMYDAAKALSEISIELGIAEDGGKDSTSMATRIGGQVVKSPRELAISGYGIVPDVRRVITPDIKKPGASQVIFIDLSDDKCSLGASALGYVYGQLGEDCPDVDVPMLKKFFGAIQELIGRDLVLAGHDRSDGGLITTILEMGFSGNAGFRLAIPNTHPALDYLLTEGPGVVIEVAHENVDQVMSILQERGVVTAQVIGLTQVAPEITILQADQLVLFDKMDNLMATWRETSYQLRRLQSNPKTALAEWRNTRHNWRGHSYAAIEPKLDLLPLTADRFIKAAVIREEGSNGDKEMVSALFLAGFQVWDVTMSDLLAGRANLADFRVVVFPGGFAYADTLGSARGWAAKILFNPRLKAMFDAFYQRPDTLSLGVCNGCQLMAQLGWVPISGLSYYDDQPVFARNESGRFESRWSAVTVLPSPAIMLEPLKGQTLGIWVAHGEGQIHFPNPVIRDFILREDLAPVRFVDDKGVITKRYPFNPNGSIFGIGALCSFDGRHLAMMPHPERAFLMHQWGYVPPEMRHFQQSPWLSMWHSAYLWCLNHQN